MPDIENPEVRSAMLNFLSGGTNAANTNSLTPLTDESLSRMGGLTGVNRPPSRLTAGYEAQFMERNQRVNIPLDMDEGIPKFQYFQIAEQSGQDAQFARAKQLYPDKNVRMLDSGDIAVEVTDSKTGKPKDVTINPSGLNAHDLIDLAVQTPEIAAGLAAFLATKGKGLPRTALSIVASSLAGGAAGYERDVIARATAGIPLEPDEILKRRGVQSAVDLFLQSGMGLAGKATRGLSPFATSKTTEFDPIAAQAFFKRWFNEDIKLLPGETTGSSVLQKVEAYETPQPGVSTIVGRLKKSGEEAIGRIRDRALGKLTPEEEIGQSAISAIHKQEVMPIETALEAARLDLETKGSSAAASVLDSLMGNFGGRVTPGQAGKVLRTAHEASLEAADSEVKKAYDVVRAIPEGQGRFIPGGSVASAAKAIRKEFPTVEKTEDVATGLLDQFGKETTVKETKEKVLTSVIPDGLEKALKDMDAQAGQGMTLDALTKLKNSAYDEIAKTEAVPGVKERWFNLVAKAYEQGIEEGIEATQNIQLKDALKNAKKTYKEKLRPFERQGLQDIPRTPYEPGFKPEEALVSRLFHGEAAQHNYRVLQDALGKDSAAFKAINRSLVDSWLEEGADYLTGKLKPEKLLSAFSEFRVSQPETFQSVFKGKGKEFEAALRSIKLARMPELDMGEVKGLIASGRVDKTSVGNLVKATLERDQAYVNSIVRAVASGAPIAERIQPARLVERLLNTNTPEGEVKSLIKALKKEDSEKASALSTAVMYRIIDEASEDQAGRLINLSQKKLDKALGPKGSDNRRRIELLLGTDPIPMLAGSKTVPPVIGAPTRMDVLENMVNILGPRQTIDKIFKSTGGMGASHAIARIIKQPLEYADRFVKKAILATAYTSDTGIKLLTNRTFGPEESAAIMNTMIASEPFLRSVIEVTGSPDAAKYIVSNAKSSIDRFISDLSGKANPGRDEMMKFLRGEKSKVEIKPTYNPKGR